MEYSPAQPSAPGFSEDRALREAVDALSDGLAVFDAERRLVSFNERYVEMLEPIAGIIAVGLRWEDCLQACAADGVYADAASRDTEWLASLGGAVSRAAEIAHADGRIYSVRYNPTSSGGFAVIRTEVTEARQAEKRLRDGEALMRTIVDGNPVPVIMARLRDGLILFRSPAARDLFGDTTFAQEHYVEPSDRDAYVRALRLNGRVDDYRLTFRTARDGILPMSANGRITEYAGEACAVTTLLDLREREAHDAIIRQVLANCPAPILMAEAGTGRVLFRGPEVDRLFGTLENTHDFYIDAGDRAGFLAALRKSGSVTDFKARFRGADGRPFWGAVSAKLIEYEGRDVIVSYSRDMTEQLELDVELSRQRERLFQNEKISALGGLLANVAHALKNPLSVVVGYALMMREETDDPELQRQADKINEAAERCTEVIRTYLTVTPKDRTDLKEADVNDIVETAADVTRHSQLSDDIMLELRLADALPQISADADQLIQVVINLLQNAQAAIEQAGKGDRIVVQTRRNARTGSVQLTVEDDGPGISRDLARKVFEPFFTTRGLGDGKGIGLTYCHRVVQEHHGQIRLDEDFRGGARFVIDLPALKGAEPEATAEEGSESAALRILVIDDEPDVADLNGEVLERGGYAATVAYSGADAIEAMRARSFDCVLSDLNMPDIDGRGFFDVIRRDFPDLLNRTGFITGDTMGRASQRFLLESGRPYLEKPVSPRELREFVAEILADGDAP